MLTKQASKTHHLERKSRDLQRKGQGLGRGDQLSGVCVGAGRGLNPHLPQLFAHSAPELLSDVPHTQGSGIDSDQGSSTWEEEVSDISDARQKIFNALW